MARTSDGDARRAGPRPPLRHSRATPGRTGRSDHGRGRYARQYTVLYGPERAGLRREWELVGGVVRK